MLQNILKQKILNSKKGTLGLLIGRINPPHIGHIRVIETALDENSKVLILLGSANKINSENIFTFEERKFFLTSYFQKETKAGKLMIDPINDTLDNKLWVKNIGTTIKNYYPDIKGSLNIYGGDLKEDTAIKIFKKYQGESKISNINYREIYRNNIKISHNGQAYDISGTNLRKAFNTLDYELVKKYIPKKTADLQISKRKEKHN